MLFPKTIQSFQNTQKHVIKDTLFDMLHSDGISVSSVDLIFGHYFIYVLLGEGMLAPVFLYEKRISYKQSQTNGLPRLHFCQCDNIQTDFNPTNKHHTLTVHCSFWVFYLFFSHIVHSNHSVPFLPPLPVPFLFPLPVPSFPSFLLLFVSFCFCHRVSLCSPGCPGTCSADQAGLELRDLPASAS